MDVLKSVLRRMVRLFAYWGLLRHPYGREYARRRFSPTGRIVDDPADPAPDRAPGPETRQHEPERIEQ